MELGALYYSKNEVTFVVPVLLPKFGILHCTKEEVEQINVKRRKLLTLLTCIEIVVQIDCTIHGKMKEKGFLVTSMYLLSA